MKPSTVSTVFCSLICLLMARASLAVPGGWNQVSNKDKASIDVANYASLVISDRSNSYYLKKMVHLHEVKRQVVAGWKYNLTFDLGTTICRKNEVTEDTISQCTVSPTHNIERCMATVWERPWLKERQLLHQECRDYLPYDQYFSEDSVAMDQNSHKDPAEGKKL